MKSKIVFKSIAGIVLLLSLLALIVSIIGFRSFTRSLLDQYADGAFRLAHTAALEVDADRIDEYFESGGETEEYKSVYDSLDTLCNGFGATFIYVIVPDVSDYAHIRFLFSTIDHESSYTHYEFGYLRDTTNDEYRAKYRALYEEGSQRELVLRDKGYIETDPHITAMVPLTASEGEVSGILCVQRQMDVLSAARKGYIHKVLIAVAIITALSCIVQALYLNRVLLRPVRTITEEASRFALENTAAETKLMDRISNRDEIGLLAGSIDHMEEQIQSYVENLTKVTAENERIETELSLAARIQAAMLPNRFSDLTDRKDFDIFASMDPAKEVGGDFYDFFMIDDDHLCALIADVSGKGVPAALFMMCSRIILKSCAMLGRSVSEILTKTNEAICDNNPAGMFVTVWIGILELSTGRLTAANAGHEYPALKRRGGGFELIKDKHGLVIGAMDGVQYREYELSLAPGDKLFVYTDGVPEAEDPQSSMFGTERMLSVLNSDPEASPEGLITNVRRAVDSFAKEAEQFDDITMLCLEYIGKEPAE